MWNGGRLLVPLDPLARNFPDPKNSLYEQLLFQTVRFYRQAKFVEGKSRIEPSAHSWCSPFFFVCLVTKATLQNRLANSTVESTTIF